MTNLHTLKEFEEWLNAELSLADMQQVSFSFHIARWGGLYFIADHPAGEMIIDFETQEQVSNTITKEDIFNLEKIDYIRCTIVNKDGAPIKLFDYGFFKND